MYETSSQHGAGHFPAVPLNYGPGYVTSGAQELIDAEHLRLLRIGYFISAGQTAFLIPFGLLYAGMGVMFSHLPMGGSSPPPPAMLSWIFGVFGGVFAGVATVGASLKLLTAIRLKERRSRVLCLVTAALCCIEVPYGTALGVMTFVVLGRHSVRQQFDS
jgi:hypothetical protein